MIDLVGKRLWFFLISAIVIIPGIISLAVFGLKPGVDFSSGTAMTLSFDKGVELSQLRQELTDLGYDRAVVQPAGEGDFFIRLPEICPSLGMTQDDVLTKLGQHRGGNLAGISPLLFPVHVLRAQTNIRVFY